METTESNIIESTEEVAPETVPKTETASEPESVPEPETPAETKTAKRP